MSSETDAGSTLDILLRSPVSPGEQLLALEVKRLRADRDDARRLFCDLLGNGGPNYPAEIAARRGWDGLYPKRDDETKTRPAPNPTKPYTRRMG